MTHIPTVSMWKRLFSFIFLSCQNAAKRASWVGGEPSCLKKKNLLFKNRKGRIKGRNGFHYLQWKLPGRPSQSTYSCCSFSSKYLFHTPLFPRTWQDSNSFLRLVKKHTYFKRLKCDGKSVAQSNNCIDISIT